MRTFIKNYIDAKKRQKLEETGEEGFSLIELIIVIVILGILFAIAIPIFANIQKNANDSAAQSAAANAATTAAVVASKVGATEALVEGDASYAKLAKAPVSTVTVTITGVDLSTLCATAAVTGGNYASWSSGPGCTADHSAT
jgi:type IV pilus assembly protein PilA